MRSILKKPSVTFLDTNNTNNSSNNAQTNNPNNTLKISSDSLADQFSQFQTPNGRLRRGQYSYQLQQPSALPYLQQSPPNYEQSFEIQPPVRSLVDQNFSSNATSLSSKHKDPLAEPPPVNPSFPGAPTIQNSSLDVSSAMPIYNAKWKDGLIDAYKQQIQQLGNAMVQLQQQNELQSAKAAELSSEKGSLANNSALTELMEGQKRMFDMYWELAKRCKHVEEVSKKQAELITSLNEMMERRESQHRREVDRLREEIYRTNRLKKKSSQRDDSGSYHSDSSNINIYRPSHPSSAPTERVERPFIESIDMNVKTQNRHRHYHSSKPPPHPNFRTQNRYDSSSRYGSPGSRFDLEPIRPRERKRNNPNLNRLNSRSPVFDSDHFNYGSSADERDDKDRHLEDSESETNDFKRDRIRTRNKLQGIESKLMELKIMTQDM
ncbi:uncharacterized protein LOC142340254 [Convolutriloba macropyga]|uniref:uncharacterized protein LOC142340254 n=1 Tax=Convolutriloba macropyga TaxID=536237 RepID=UPI003F52128C